MIISKLINFCNKYELRKRLLYYLYSIFFLINFENIKKIKKMKKENNYGR